MYTYMCMRIYFFCLQKLKGDQCILKWGLNHRAVCLALVPGLVFCPRIKTQRGRPGIEAAIYNVKKPNQSDTDYIKFTYTNVLYFYNNVGYTHSSYNRDNFSQGVSKIVVPNM